MKGIQGFPSGKNHHGWKGGRTISAQGYVIVALGKGKPKLEHIVKAEKALGKSLPPRAEVHHFDEDKTNNENRNLVICNDKGYHRILHIRKSLLDRGIDPRTHKPCAKCKAIKPLTEFHRNKLSGDGLCHYCKPCNCAHARATPKKKLFECCYPGLRITEV